MRRQLIYFVIFLALFGVRYATLSDLVPNAWKSGDLIRLRGVVVEEPVQTGSFRIYRFGRVFVHVPSITPLEPRQRVEIIGTPIRRVIGKKTVRIDVIDPTINAVSSSKEQTLGLRSHLFLGLATFRQRLTTMLQRFLPEPQASLAAGMLMGTKVGIPRDFYEALVATGTVHTIAASGYNVTLIAVATLTLLTKLLKRSWGLLALYGLLVGYAVLAGLSPAIVRATLMAVIISLAYFFGREVESKRALWVSGALMTLIDPLLIWDIGFQLSVAATAGLLYIHLIRGRGFLRETAGSTAAAGLATAPFILYHFGQVCWISPLANLLVLWLVPPIMVFSAGAVVGGLVSPYFGYPLAILASVPLTVFVTLVKALSHLID